MFVYQQIHFLAFKKSIIQLKYFQHMSHQGSEYFSVTLLQIISNVYLLKIDILYQTYWYNLIGF